MTDRPVPQIVEVRGDALLLKAPIVAPARVFQRREAERLADLLEAVPRWDWFHAHAHAFAQQIRTGLTKTATTP